MLYAAVVLIMASAAYAQIGNSLESARAAGLGGAYLAIGDDVSAVASNPAGLMRMNRTQLIGSYTRFHTGANIPSLQEGSLFFSPFEWTRWFFAFGASYFNHDIYNQQIGSFVVGRELYRKRNAFRLAAAVNANIFRVDYNNINFSEDFDPNDPVFRDGFTKMNYGADFSMLAEIGRLSIGAKAYNLNEPEISLRAGAEGGTLARKVRGGLSYNILDIVTPAVEVEVPVSSAPTVSDEMSFAVGAESWFVNKMLGARAGFSSMASSDTDSKGSAVSLGLSFRSRKEWDAGIDYAIKIPIDSPTEFGQTHKVSLVIGMRQPTRVITDLAVVPNSVKAVPTYVIPGGSAKISAEIANYGDMDARNFPMCLYYFVDGKPFIANKITIDELDAGKSAEVLLDFAPTKPGRYELFASVNDHGDKAPAVNNKVLEYDLENNTGQTTLDCYGPPVFDGEIRTSKDQLEISTISRVKEEAPMVPMIFFDRASDVVKQGRFDTGLRTIADRLKKNPGTAIELRGHYDASGEVEAGARLAVARAQNVKDYFLKLGVDPKQVFVIEEGYDMAANLVQGASPEFKAKIQEENRNVDIKVRLQEQSRLCEVYHSDGHIEASDEAIASCSSALNSVISYLEQNPDVNIVFFGIPNCSSNDCFKTAYDGAVALREIMQKQVPQALASRMFVLTSSYSVPDEKAKVEMLLDGDAIIFRPRGTTAGREALEFAELDQMVITIDPIKTEVGLDSFAVFVTEEKSTEPFAILKTGKGEPPTSLEWSWFGTSGRPPDPDSKYFVEVFAKDIYGQSVSAKSKPITIKVQEQEERRELFIISFDFGKTEATSQFLEARVEALAERVIERAKFLGPNVSIKATVIGHTDVVGSPSANEELSLERAKKEFNRLQYGMMKVLNLSSIGQLDEWLKTHRVELGYEGRSFKEPMVVKFWEQGYWRSELVGDNELPEGRLVNRRVVLEVLTLTR